MSTIGAKPPAGPSGAAIADSAAVPLAGRLGLSVPYEWWASAALLKSYEAAGFGWVQLHSPPPSVLRDHHFCARHAGALAEALGTTSLNAVIHAPGGLRLGDPEADRTFEGLLAYAAELGAEQIVYHAMALPDSPDSDAPLSAEARSLETLVPVAERLEITIAVENLAPVYPGLETLSASPITLRALIQRIGSDRLALCLDVGHAHVTADLRHTGVEKLCEPAVDVVSVFHLHDNLGARWTPAGDELGVDPLRLDLHLPPGRGTLPWRRVAEMLAGHRAPLVLEVHPPYRPRASDLASAAGRLIR